MLRFTIYQGPKTAPDPGDLLLDPERITAVVEATEGPLLVAIIFTLDGRHWVVYDKERNTGDRIKRFVRMGPTDDEDAE